MAKVATKARGGKFADEKYYGPEPTLNENSTPSEEAHLYNWFNYFYTNEDAKGFVLAYLKQIKFDKQKMRKLSSVPAYLMRSVGWHCRVLTEGGKLPPKIDAALWVKLDQLASKAVESVTEVVDAELESSHNEHIEAAKVVSIRERVDAKASNLIADVEDLIDAFYEDGKTFDAAKWFREKDVKPLIAQKIADFYRPLYSEIYDAMNGKDEQLKEAYSHWKKPKLKAYLEFIRGIIGAAEQRDVIAKAIRKPRKVKEKPAASIVSKLQFMEESKEFSLKSLRSVEVVGAQQLWTFNVKYRTLTVYNAIGPAGLSVKGTTIIGFDEKTSVVKKLRKPSDTLKTLSDAGKVTLRKFMDTIKAVSKPANGRINKDTVLVRVGK
jgi:hypothetical protein